MAEAKEAAQKKKQNKLLVQLEERYKKLYKDKKSIDECFKTVMTADAFAEYAKIEIGSIDTAILLNMINAQNMPATAHKETKTEETDCQILTQDTFILQSKQISELSLATTDLNSKIKLINQEIASKTEELNTFRRKEEQKITNEAQSLLSKLKFGNSESEALQNKYNDLLSSYNQLKIDMQKKMQEARVFKQFREPMVSKSTETQEEEDKVTTEEKESQKTTKNTDVEQDELLMLKSEFTKSKEKALQMLMEKDREISSLKNSLSESQNMSHKMEMSVGNKLNSNNLKALEYDEEISNLKNALGIHIKNEQQLADKIKSMQHPEITNIEYIKNIFLKYQLYSRLNEKTEMLMMQNILYDILRVTNAEKEDVNKGKHGLIWKAMHKANPDSLYALISGKTNGRFSKPQPTSRSTIDAFQMHDKPNI